MCRALRLAGFLSLLVRMTIETATTERMSSRDDFADPSLAGRTETSALYNLSSQGFEETTKMVSPGANGPVVQSEGIVSTEDRVFILQVLMKVRYVILPFALVATVCNVVVFMQKALRSSTSKYVIALSLAQILTLLIDIGLHVMLASIQGNVAKHYVYFAYGLYIFNYVIIIRRGSFIVMCLVSLERMYAIVRPLHIKSFVLVRHPLLFIFGTYSLTIGYHFYIPARYAIRESKLSDGSTVYFRTLTTFYVKNQKEMDNFAISAKVIFSYLPLLFLVILNVATVFFLRLLSSARQNLKTTMNAKEEEKRQRQMTITILGATIGYVVLSLPFALVALINNFHPVYNFQGPERNLLLVLQEISYECILLSCFTDFLSFLLLSSAFRRTFLRVFHLNRFVRRERLAADDTVTVDVSISNVTA
ncbi:hypothetical protein BaRGS_00037814 [Batillaria attramentaria]|uniref:G-protein coupled receptors family 1 profile domain-containing protein n=1 Tax=Batillaria attramentaria TaxID=370345 RepID=A0ABD0J7X6_9CAEN